jgi:predicted nucleic acid-binding protein
VIVYLDTSVVLRLLFGQAKSLVSDANWSETCSSELLGVEARRAVDRLRLEVSLDDAGVVALHQALARFERTITWIPLNRPVLRRAALPMATAVRTLDALHLASALIRRERSAEPVTFATHDARQAGAARALGFDCIGV